MIYGIGTDLVDIDRIKAMPSRDLFAKKILGLLEMEKYNTLDGEAQINYLGKQFAAKEAFAKALGTGFRDPIFPKDIQVIRNTDGKPEILLSEGTKSYITGLGITKTHVSLADERNHLIAFAILEI